VRCLCKGSILLNHNAKTDAQAITFLQEDAMARRWVILRSMNPPPAPDPDGIGPRRRNRAETISACNRAMVRAAGEAELQQQICQVLVEQGGYRLAWIGYAKEDEGKSVHIAAARAATGATWPVPTSLGPTPANADAAPPASPSARAAGHRQ